jgi:hypothetical protein
MVAAARIAFGFSAHSGWAALVAVGELRGELQVVDRRRLELVDAKDASWAKQPYHAAEQLEASAARALVNRGIAAAKRVSTREMRAAVGDMRRMGHNVVACGVLVGTPMPVWSTDEILAVHFRMHKAEGVLFRDMLKHAAGECGLRVAAVPEKQLLEEAALMQTKTGRSLRDALAALGKVAGPPWGKDQKNAALAAIIALHGGSRA